MNHKKDESMQLGQLGHPINNTDLTESLWNDKCDYLHIDRCKNLNPNNYNMNIIQPNIRSLLAHQHELEDLLQQLQNKNSTIDVVALSETFLTKKVEKLVNVPGYQLFSNCCIEH